MDPKISIEVVAALEAVLNPALDTGGVQITEGGNLYRVDRFRNGQFDVAMIVGEERETLPCSPTYLRLVLAAWVGAAATQTLAAGHAGG